MSFTPRFVDLVRNYTTTQGTGNFTLGNAVTGYRGFRDVMEPGESFYYSAIGIEKPAEHEVGRGTLLADGSVQREAISGSLTDFTGGHKTIALIAAAEWFDAIQAGASAPTSRVVATRAELQGLSNRQAPALLHERGREGTFVFDPSDHSANVASDERQGVFVAPAFDPSGASGTWVRIVGRALDAAWFGTAADGVTDDYEAIQSALDLAGGNAIANSVRVPAGTYSVAQSLSVADGVTLEGEGKGTVIKATNSSFPHVIKLTGKSGAIIRDLKLTGWSSGANRASIYIDNCTNITIRNIVSEGHSDCYGIWLLNSDDCLVDNLYLDGTTGAGTAAYIAGCKRCRVVNSTARRCNFGFIIVGALQPLVTRSDSEVFGNVLANCSVSDHHGHAFDINGATGCVVTGCTAEDYAGASTHVAFQSKGVTDDSTRSNVFIGCTAKDVPSGFGGQLSAHTAFIGCSAYNVSNHGIFLNGMAKCQVVGCNIFEFGVGGIWLGSGSTSNSFNNIHLETSASAAKGVILSGAGNNNNTFDNITTASALGAFIDIAAGNNNSRFGMGCRSGDNPIVDSSGTSIWPVVASTPVMSLAASGTQVGEYMHRGMHVAVARFVITSTVGGTPMVGAGRVGATQQIAAAQAIAGVASQTVTLEQQTQLLDPAGIVSGTCTVTGTGAGFIQFEGLPRL